MKENTFYFQHDYNARGDLKTQALLHDFKAKGYGIYWVVVEMLHEVPEHKLPLKPYTFIAIAQQVNETPEMIEKVISACISKYDLFFNTDGFIESKRVNINIVKRTEISSKRANSGKQGAIAKQMLANAKQNLAKERKGKEKKEKEIINISFDTFWDLYDKKVDRKKCMDKWEAFEDSEREAIIDVLPTYIERTPDIQFRKNPLTFFNCRSWEDEDLKISHPGIPTLKVIKAVRLNEDDNVIYEDGKIFPPFSFNEFQDVKAGKKNISVFDRKVS